jgi:peptide/nickel transport system ATP-binding protein
MSDHTSQAEMQPNTLLEIRELKKHFPIEKGLLKKVVGYVRAVDGVNLVIREGETLGLVGESGCGKTTLGHCVLRAVEPTSGSVLFRTDGQVVDLATLERRMLRPYRKHIQMVFQDPYSSLDPRKTVFDIIAEPLIVNHIVSGHALETKVRDMAEAVGLNYRYLKRYPHAFSGGQRQRIGIARALVLNPELIVCDEPVSALDVSIQAQILNLLQDLQAKFHLTYLFIAHDLSVVEHISDEIAVMYVGKLVERAETGELFRHPYHPYTEALLSAVPRPDPDLPLQEIPLAGEVPSPANPPSGCYFHPRCRYAQPICSQAEPQLVSIEGTHQAACHFAGKLSLHGVE